MEADTGSWADGPEGSQTTGSAASAAVRGAMAVNDKAVWGKYIFYDYRNTNLGIVLEDSMQSVFYFYAFLIHIMPQLMLQHRTTNRCSARRVTRHVPGQFVHHQSC